MRHWIQACSNHAWAPLLLGLAVATPVAAQQVPPLNRYNSVAETYYRLGLCGELTAERKEWLLHLTELAKRPLDWSPDQWLAYDVELTTDLKRLYPSVPRDKCAELARMVDHERKTVPRAK